MQISSNIGAIKQDLSNFRKELLGNGQPGRIQMIEKDVEEHKDKISNLDKTKWMAVGALVVLGHMAENIGKWALIKLGIIH